MACTFLGFLLCISLFATLTVATQVYTSNVYGADLLFSLQSAISSKGCLGGLCVCAEYNRDWGGVLSTGIPLPSVMADRTPDNFDEVKATERGRRQVNRIADSMPIVGQILDTCRWSRELFSEKFFHVLKELQQQTRNSAKIESVKAAICELSEAVDDPEPEGEGTQVPLFSLYLRYKQRYLADKTAVDKEIKSARNSLTAEEFQEWYNEHQENMKCKVDSAYQKWEIFGSKRKVEDLMFKHDIISDSSAVTNAIGLYEAVRDLQTRSDNLAEGTMPVSLRPDGWEQLTERTLTGTRDQLLFQIGQLKLEKSSLEAKLRAKTLQNATDSALVLKRRFDQQLRKVMVLARKVRETRLLCQGGVGNCSLLAKYQKLYQEAANDFIQAYIVYKSNQVSEDVHRQIAELNLAIAQTESRLAISNALSVAANALGGITESFKQYSTNFEWVPSDEGLEERISKLNLTGGMHKRPFLFIQTPPEEGCADCFKVFHEVIPEKVTARLYFLGMERNWFDPAFFQKSFIKKLLLERKEPFAPDQKPEAELLKDLANTAYILPYYPISMVMATKVEIHLRNVSSNAAVDIYKAAFASSPLSVGFGPFSVRTTLEETYEGEYRYNAEGMMDVSQGISTESHRMKIRLDGGQIIGLQYLLLEAAKMQDIYLQAPQSVPLFNATTMPPSQ